MVVEVVEVVVVVVEEGRGGRGTREGLAILILSLILFSLDCDIPTRFGARNTVRLPRLSRLRAEARAVI